MCDISDPGSSPVPRIYRPVAPTLPTGTNFFELQFRGPLSDVIARVRNISTSVDSHIGLEFRLASDDIHEMFWREHLVGELAGFFALLSILLAAIGIYGVTSYVVAQRTTEIGIRMALGADRKSVINMVLLQAMRVILCGVLMGVPLSLWDARVIRGMLFGVTPADPLVYALSTALLLRIAAIAAFLPAQRASKLDPVVALRFE